MHSGKLGFRVSLVLVVGLALVGPLSTSRGQSPVSRGDELGRESTPADIQVQRLRESVPDVRVSVDPLTGLATFVGFSAEGWDGDRQVGTHSREIQARALLRRFGGAFGIPDPDGMLVAAGEARNVNGSQIVLQQVHGGVPVLDAGVRVYFNDALQPTAIDSRFHHDVAIDPRPSLTAAEAQDMAFASAGTAVSKTDTEAQLYIYRAADGFDFLVYRLALGESGDLLVDAHSGNPVGKTVAGQQAETRFEVHIVDAVGASPVNVPLTHTYADPVVVCTAVYENNTVPVVTRVSLPGAPPHSSFDVRLQNPGDLRPVAAEAVHCLVMSSGSHVIDGHKVEAQNYLSTVTARKNSWPGQAQAYLQSYAKPVVVGQVMSENDPDWSVFWDQGGSRTSPPSPTALTTGKTVAEDTSTGRVNEVVGFIVFDAYHGMIGGVEFEARLGGQTISGIANGPPFVYAFDTAFAAAPEVAVHSMAGVVGGDGGWSQSFGGSPFTTASTLRLSVDEDQITDAERSHGTERVAYVVFATEVAFPFVTPSGCPGGTDAECDDGLFCNGVETCNSGESTCEPGLPPCSGLEICQEDLDSCVTGPTLRIESGVVPTLVGSTPTTVNLAHSYASPVVICNIQYLNNGTPVVARVGNVTANSFDVRIQSPAGDPVQPETVHYLVVEEGTWQTGGISFEAHKYLSTVTDNKNSWIGSARTYDQPYVSPVVIGQVMSENDPDFSVYWQQGATRTVAPNSAALKNGKTVLEDSDKTRADETIGYVVFEAVHAALLGVEMEAYTGLDTIQGAVNGAPFTYILNQAFPATPAVVLTSMAGVDGGDGGWSQSHGMTVGTASTLNLSVDEDTITDAERSHTHEQVSYVAFATPLVFPEPPQPTCTEDAECAGFSDFCDGPDTCFNGACVKGAPPCGPGEQCTSLGGGNGVCVPPAVKLETISLTGVGGLGGQPASPAFQNGPYDSPVVVCSAQYASNTRPFVVRVGNVTSTGFDVWLQSPGDLTPVLPENVYCLVVEEGVWTVDGHRIEAQKYTSSLTDRERNWLGVAQTMNHPFVNPVVLGQVMSTNDARWSTYWQQGNAQTNPPASGFLRNGKAVMEDPDIVRLDETVGFIVFEQGHGTLAGVNFEARLGADTVLGVVNGAPFTYNFATPFDTTPGFAVVTQAGMDGSDGSWAYLFGPAPLTSTSIDLAVDEDQLFNLERGHSSEQVGYIVFEEPVSISAVKPPGSLTAGQNINIVAGSNWPGGDPFLQRQNEPSGAVSSRSVMNLLVGANDYRTVDIPGLPEGKVTGDAWLGIFKSYDGGNTWRSDLVPGYPQDTSADGRVSPLFGYDAGADPVIRAGAHGLFLYSGIVFDRGPDAKSATFVARYIDMNNDPAGDSIRYLDTVLVEADPGGPTSTGFIDKTWLAVDVPRQGLDPASFPFETVTLDVPQELNKVAQQITCGNAYLTLSRILGEGTSSEISITRSTDCGATWSTPVLISSECAISQGSAIAIDPRTGDVHVAWRQFAGTPSKGAACPGGAPPSAILATRSTDGGRTFAPPAIVAEIAPFDQPSNFNNVFLSFRSNAFPTMTVDAEGRAYVAWTTRGLAADSDPLVGDSRIVVSTSRNGTTWTAPRVVDEPGVRGHQIKPSLTFAHDKVALAFYDFREDLSRAFQPLVVDLDGAPGLTPLPAHTVDVRAAIAEPSDNPLFTMNSVIAGQPSTRASKYQYILGGEDENDAEFIQFDANRTNLPLFVGGGVPFIGDYIDIFTQSMSANPDGSWTFKNGGTAPSQQWHVVWADNRDVVPPPDNDWTNYKPPLSPQNPEGGGPSLFDPDQFVPVCNPADAQDVQRTGMRNQNIYTTRLTQGLFTGSPSNSKPLGTIPGNADLFQRSFVVWVQNTTEFDKFFRLTVANQPAGGQASFDQFALQTTFEILTGPNSGVARTVFVTSTQTQATINVVVQEIDAFEGEVVPGGLSNTVLLNPDPINPEPVDPSLTQQEIFNLAILNLAILNPAILNQDVENLAILNLAILNPAILNLAILNSADPNLAILNPAILNLAILNLAILNPAILNPAILNSADPSLAILNLAILNPAILNLAILNPAILNGALTDVTYTVENQGNSTAAYDFHAALNSPDDPLDKGGEPAEPPLAFSLMVYKSYATPGVGEDCQLGEETLHELLVNVVNPNLDPLNIEQVDASFFLAPAERAFITLRVLDFDETVGEPFDPEQLEVAIQSQGVNTEDLPDGQPPFAIPPPSGRILPAVAAAGIGQTITIFGDPDFPVDVEDLVVEFSQSPAVPGTIIEDASTDEALYVRLPEELNPGLAEVKVIDSGSGAALYGAFITVAETPSAPEALAIVRASTLEGGVYPCGFAFTPQFDVASIRTGDWILVPAHGIDLEHARVQFEVPGSGVAPVVVSAECSIANTDWGIAAVAQVPALPPGTVEIRVGTQVDGIESPLSNALSVANVCGNGIIDGGESCDPPGSDEGETFECRDTCTYCGDGSVDYTVIDCVEIDLGGPDPGFTCTFVEACDDGNNVDGDGCSADCVIEFCGDGSVQSSGTSLAAIPLDPRATYLVTSSDPGALDATPIDLAALGIFPGQLLRIEVLGLYADDGVNENARFASAVFSGSNVLLGSTFGDRVQDAIEAGLNTTTLSTLNGSVSTNIPEDFFLPPGGTDIVVPAGATHLFVSTFSNFFGDNTDSDGDWELSLTPLSGEACDDGNTAPGDGCEPDCTFTPGSLLLHDDDFVEVALPFAFPFCGSEYDSVFVGSNGHLTFGAGTTLVLDSVDSFLERSPAIAGLAYDLDPSDGGAIVARTVAGEFEVSFIDVPRSTATAKSGAPGTDKAPNSNTFTFLLRSDGSYVVSYGAVSLVDGLAGRAPGGNLHHNEIDLTRAVPSPIPFRTAYESFDDDNDLAFETTDWAACPAFEIAAPGVLYAAGDNNDGYFLSVDPATGYGDFIGETDLANGVSALAINSRGEIFATHGALNELHRIDAGTGEATLATPLSLGSIEALAFDENDVLYGRDSSGLLLTIDTLTGAVTPVGSDDQQLTGLAFDAAGQLFGSTSSGGSTDSIFRIDVGTGAVEDLGETGLFRDTPDIAFLDGVLYGLAQDEVISELFSVADPLVSTSGALIGEVGDREIASLATRTPSCGDGRTDPGEQCDDGNGAGGDGCETTCVLTALTLADDDAVLVEIPFFDFPFCGVAYDRLYVGSNGYVTFGAPDTSAAASVAGLLAGPPRVAGLWLDLKPDVGGQVTAGPVGNDTFVVRFTEVPDGAGALNSFSLTLGVGGSIVVDYGTIATQDAILVGRSSGGGAADPGETNIDAASQPIGGGLITVYELFDGAPADALDLGGVAFVGCFHPAAAGVCYASTGFADGGRLLVLDAFAPSATVIGETGVPAMPGLAINSRGEIFGSGSSPGALYRIDAQTGLATWTGHSGLPSMEAIAFDGNDVLYTVGFVGAGEGTLSTLRTIDVDAGTTTILGFIGDFIVGLAFDPTDGKLYATNTNDQVLELDTSTGDRTVIGYTQHSGPTPDLCFLGDTLFASKGGGGSPNNRVITIDKTTGAGTLVGSIPIRSISGLASRQSCGDGVIGLGETCETPGEPAGQPDECRENLCTFCGDGVVNHDEACDDGNNNDLDGCQANCQLISWVAYPAADGLVSDCVGPEGAPGQTWTDVAFDDSGWTPVDLPDIWFAELADRFYRGTFFADAAGQPFNLTFQSDDGIRIFVNGSLAAEYGDCHQPGCVNAKYEWPCGESTTAPAIDLSAWVQPGVNVIAVHVTDGGGLARFDAQFGPDVTQSLDLSHNDSVEVALPFSFPLCGASHDTLFVNSSGSVTFGAGDTTDFFLLSDFLQGPPRIAALWNGLNPGAGGTIDVTGSTSGVAVRFDQVANLSGTAFNTFTIRLFPDGTSEVEYGDLGSPFGIAGRTTGLNATDPGEVDLGAQAAPIGPGTNTVYELFDSGAADLAGTTLAYAACALKAALPGVCYGSTGSSDFVPGRLITVDLDTGDGTEIARTGLPRVPALAINSSGEMFATDGIDGNLYRVDAENGDLVWIGSPGNIEGMAFDDTDTLYGVATAIGSGLSIIDPTSGELTDLGGSQPTGLTVGLAFDPASDTLFGSSNHADPRAIYTFDRGTGDFTVLGQTGHGQSTPDLCAVDGVLYGTVGDSSPSSIRRLIQIDTTSAAGTDIGSIGFRGVAGLASRVPSCGDGRIDAILSEACDDGNSTLGDGCEGCVITPIPLTDDDFVEISLPFSFPFCGIAYDSLFVGSNGYVTFGAGDTDSTPTTAELLSGPPRIAGLWSDLNPAAGGTVTVEADSHEFRIVFAGVPRKSDCGEFVCDTVLSNSFTITLSRDGTIAIEHTSINSPAALVGRSRGNGAPDPGETDLGALAEPAGAGQVTIYELFTGGGDAFDLAGAEFVGCWNPAAPGVCYGTRGGGDFEDDSGQLMTIDVGTGLATIIAETGVGEGLPGLAINTRGEIFATARVAGDLYRVDALTGLSTFIGSTGSAAFGAFHGIAFDANDVLWGTTGESGELKTIDTTTAATTAVGPLHSYDFEHLPGLAFDPRDGTLWGSTFNGSQIHQLLDVNPAEAYDGIVTLDTSNGQASLIGETGLAETLFMGHRMRTSTPDLCFVDGELYGAKGGGGSNDNVLIHIATSTIGGSLLVYEADFDAPATVLPGVDADLSGPHTIESSQGFAGVGAISGDFLHNASGGPPGFEGVRGTPSVLTLGNLPPHDSIRIDFLLALINTWDGFGGSYCCDDFEVLVDGVSVFRESFDHDNQANQSYQPLVSGAFPNTGGILMPGGLLTPRPFSDLGFPSVDSASEPDGVYDMGREVALTRIPHTAATATIEFVATGFDWEGGVNESWAMDALRVELLTDPAATPVGLMGQNSVSGLATRFPTCGDGHVDAELGEDCDDGNDDPDDGCAGCSD